MRSNIILCAGLALALASPAQAAGATSEATQAATAILMANSVCSKSKAKPFFDADMVELYVRAAAAEMGVGADEAVINLGAIATVNAMTMKSLGTTGSFCREMKQIRDAGAA